MTASEQQSLSGSAPRPFVARDPIHEQILPHIRRDIIENRWKPGERLPEPVLCREFGISRTPLRDALKLLEAEGLVELRPHVGAVVTEPGLPDLREKMQVLASLEGLAAALVAARRDPALIEPIERLHRAMAQAAKRRDTPAYYALNDEFHRAIVEASGNRTLAQMHETVMWHVFRARHLANEHEPVSAVAAQHHDEIVSHLRDGRPDRARRAMERHLEDVSRLMFAARASGPGEDR